MTEVLHQTQYSMGIQQHSNQTGTPMESCILNDLWTMQLSSNLPMDDEPHPPVGNQ
jgi:hypothetical protein